MKHVFQSPVMEALSFAVTDILCSSVGGGGGVPEPTAAPTTAPVTTVPPTTLAPTPGGDNYRDDIF